MKKNPFSLKETRLYIALALLIQSFTFFIMFIILCVKKKSIAAAFLAVSAAEGATGAYLLYQCKEDAALEFDAERMLEEDAGLDIDEAMLSADLASGLDEEDYVPMHKRPIPREEQVSEEEFQ